MMKKTKHNKFGLISKLLLGALALAVMVGLGIVVQGARENGDKEPDSLLSRQTVLFNPFAPETGSLETKSSSGTNTFGAVKTRPAIWVPLRPPVRSPFRPSWIQGSSSEKEGTLVKKNSSS